jgi:hypothetical protein
MAKLTYPIHLIAKHRTFQQLANIRRCSCTHTRRPVIHRSGRTNPWNTLPRRRTPLNRHITGPFIDITQRRLELRIRIRFVTQASRILYPPLFPLLFQIVFDPFGGLINDTPQPFVGVGMAQVSTPILLHLLHRHLRELLSEHLLQHVLFPGLVVANTDNNARRDITRNAAAENHCRESKRPDVV